MYKHKVYYNSQILTIKNVIVEIFSVLLPCGDYCLHNNSLLLITVWYGELCGKMNSMVQVYELGSDGKWVSDVAQLGESS